MQEQQERRAPLRHVRVVADAEDGSVEASRADAADSTYRALFQSAKDAIVLADEDGRYVDANPAATELLGYPRQELLGMRISDVVSAESGWTEEEFQRFLEQGHWRGEIQLRCKDGSLVDVEAFASTIEMESGRLYASVLRDLTDRKRVREERAEALRAEQEARAQAEAARQQVRLVSDVSELLAVSLEYPGALVRLAELMVREVADLCLIDMVDETGAIRRAAAVHANQSKQALADRLAQEYPPTRGGTGPINETLLTGKPTLSPSVSERSLREMTQDEEHLRIVRELGVQSFLCVPLSARGRTLGVLTLISTNPDIRYGESELRVAQEIARRAGVRIDNARLYDERDRTAKVLQRSLLPPELPAIPHVDLAARYLPFGEGNEVGGDFYDVFDCGDGTWAAVVGDVCGKGPEAAAVMGVVRHTLRALARFQRRPSSVLQELNQSLLDHGVDDRFCTVCYLRLRPSENHVRVTLCSAGHPLPLVLRRDGRLQSVGKPGQLLGILPEVSLVDSVIDLRLGDRLVLYTDGATEQRRAAPVSDETALRDAVAASLGRDADATAVGIERALAVARGSSPARDDVALLVIRAAEGADSVTRS